MEYLIEQFDDLKIYERWKGKGSIRILGIDTGLANIGWAVLEATLQSVKLISSGVIQTEARTPIGERLNIIRGSFKKIIEEHEVQLMAYEELFFNSSNMMVTNLAVGVIVQLGYEYGLNPKSFRPQDAKYYVTRSNSANKEEVATGVAIHLGMLPNQLKKLQSVDHATDAMAHGLCYWGFLKENYLSLRSPQSVGSRTNVNPQQKKTKKASQTSNVLKPKKNTRKLNKKT